MRRLRLFCLLALAVLSLLVLGGGLAVTRAATQPASRYFPETGHTVQGRFLAYWEQHGGLPQQGYPLTEERAEISETAGKTYTVQYFERAVFEYHPENAGTPYEVLLSLLGAQEYRRRYPNGAPNPQPNPAPGSIVFRETGKRLGGSFLAYWQTHGGLAQQGFPISDEFAETSTLDGQTRTVQYFERAVFEAHPENKGTPYEVLLAQLGNYRYHARYGDLALPPPVPGHQQSQPRGSGSYLVWLDGLVDQSPVSTVQALDLQTGRMRTITRTPRPRYDLAIDGSLVVWTEQSGDCPACELDLLGVDLGTGLTFTVAAGPGRAAAPAIHGQTVVWVQYGAGEARLLGRVLPAGPVFTIAGKPGDPSDILFSAPAVAGSGVYWADLTLAGPHHQFAYQIRAYNWQTQAVTDLFAGTSDSMAYVPELATNGRYLVWTDPQVWLYDPVTGLARPLAGPPPALSFSPLIANNRLIVAVGNDLWGQELPDGALVRLVPGTSDNIQREPTVAGTWLVWVAGGGRLQARRLDTTFANPGATPVPGVIVITPRPTGP